jgi:putative ABC transport system permease protein
VRPSFWRRIPGNWNYLLRVFARRPEADVDAELRFHFDERIAELTSQGFSPDTARKRAHEEFGDVDAVRTRLEEIDHRTANRRRRADWWETVFDDVRFAIRGLRRSPGWTAVALLTLALGIGANAAIFTVADRMFLRAPRGVVDPASLRRLYVRNHWSTDRSTVINPEVSVAAFQYLTAGLADRAQLVANTRPDTVPLGVGDTCSVVRASYVSDNYFAVLGVHPASGRFFVRDEDRMGNGSPVAVISYPLWRQRFGGDPDVLGRTVDIAFQPYTIIGIAAREFVGADLDAAEVWLPLATLGAPPMSESMPWYAMWRSSVGVQILARLSNRATGDWLSSAGTAIWRRGELASEMRSPDTSAVLLTGPLLELRGPSVTPATAAAVEATLVGVAVIVLVIAGANVASLFFVRIFGRRREIVIRLALGVSSRRLLMQFLTESVVLAMAAGTAAFFVGAWIGSALSTMLMPDVNWGTPVLDLRAALVTAAVSFVMGLLVGVLPARIATRLDVGTAIRGGANRGASSHKRVRSALIIAQVALSLVLLVGAGLFVRSLHRIRGIDLGYDADRIVFAHVRSVNALGHYVESYPASRTAELTLGLAKAAERIRRIPGVEETALATSGPMAGYAGMRAWRRDGAPMPVVAKRDAALIGVTSSFFRAAGVRLVRGRLFNDADSEGAAPVVVVNETAAMSYWPGEEALGQCLILLRPTFSCATVVGVTKASHLEDVVEAPTVELFGPVRQLQAQVPFLSPRVLVVRATPDRVAAIAEETRRELQRSLPAGVPVVTRLATVLEPQVRPWRLGAELFSALAALALAIAAVGVYGLLTYTFSQRAHEIGVRVALGAQRGDMVRMVLAEALATVGAGVVVGAMLAFASARFVGSLLYEVSAHDPISLGVGGVVLLLVGVMASVLPAMRASRVDPIVALRVD